MVDFLLGVGAHGQVEALMGGEGELAAPDLLVFEVLAVLRRQTLKGAIAENRAAAAVEDLGDLPIELFGSLPMRARAFGLRHNLAAADALFATLAEQLGEPLATGDAALAVALAEHTSVEVLRLDADA